MLQPTLRKIVITCIITLLLTPLLALNGDWIWSQPTDGAILLQAPPFFNSAQAQGGTFADEEAGIAAYFNAGTSINLSNASLRSLYRTFDTQTGDYLLGSAYVSETNADLDYSENDDAKLYVSADGWVMAYYPRSAPTSKIFDWLNWNGEGVVPTKLGQVLSDAASAVGAQQSTEPTYYHFAYPNANRVMLIADEIIVTNTSNSNSFNFTPPGTTGFSYFEWSYSLAAFHNSGTRVAYSLNGTSLKEANVKQIFYEKFSGIQPQIGQINTVTISSGSTCCARGASGLTIIYRVP